VSPQKPVAGVILKLRNLPNEKLSGFFVVIEIGNKIPAIEVEENFYNREFSTILRTQRFQSFLCFLKFLFAINN